MSIKTLNGASHTRIQTSLTYGDAKIDAKNNIVVGHVPRVHRGSIGPLSKRSLDQRAFFGERVFRFG